MAALRHPLPPPPVALPPQPNDPNVPLPVAQAVALPWFQSATQQLRIDFRNDLRRIIRAEILPALKRLMNQGTEGSDVPLEVVLFVNGTDPTQPPNNLPPLHSVNTIENLNGHVLVQ